MMSKVTWFSSVAILAVVAGCASDDASDFSGTAAQAIAELEVADAASVRACEKKADECRADDAAGEAICGELANSCDHLDKQLGQVRSEAVGCWEGVAQCKGDECEARAEGCQKLGETVGEARKPVVECGQHVQSCMLKAAEGGQKDMANLCGELEAACGAGVAEASMDQVRTRAREIMSAEESGSGDGTQTQTKSQSGDGSGSGDGAQAQAGDGEASGEAAQTQAQAGEAVQSQQQECLDTIARCGQQASKAGADLGKLGQSGGACDLSSCGA